MQPIVIEGVLGLIFLFGVSTACWRVGKILKIVREIRDDVEMIKSTQQRDHARKAASRLV